MSSYVFGGKLSYEDYLTARSFSKDTISATREAGRRVSMDISQQTREIIASDQALAREGISAIEASTERISGTVSEGFSDLSDAMDEGFSRLSYDLQDISSGIAELNATFHWAFGQVIASVGRMNDTLSDLIKIARTPAQTAAYEQYEIARDAFRQKLYAECLESLEKAISGDRTSPGHKLEWRFHQMKGTIQLGWAGGDLTLIDHTKAEESFLLAARYAKADYPEHAAQSFLSAGWVAYCQGKIKEALAHTEAAISINPRFGEAFFQAAKVLMALGDVDAALPMLEKAIDIDRFYALKAAGDGDFQKHEKNLSDFLDALREEKYRQSVPLVKNALEKLRFWRGPLVETLCSKDVTRMHNFLDEGSCWSLFDILSVAQEIDRTVAGFISVPVAFTVTGPDVTSSYEESYPEEERYQEEVVVKSGSFFRKPVTEMQIKTRIVNKKRTVTKTIPGKTTRIEFCYVSPGSFEMGEGGNKRTVIIGRDFLLGKHPVTQSQWEAIMGNNPSNLRGATFPVVQVTWDDCQEFIARLREKEGFNNYRLPSEAEWEYACRAGSDTAYFFGDNETQLGEYCWYDANSGNRTQPVGYKKPNAWGLYDMHGNVWEWCEDWYTDILPKQAADPKGPSSGLFRVIRGGRPINRLDFDPM